MRAARVIDTAAPGFSPQRVPVLIWGNTAELTGRLAYQGQRDRFEIEAGFRTDFASVPRVLQWLVPRTGTWTLAAILHDRLCTGLAEGKPLASARDTDGIFRRVLREAGVPRARRWLMWDAVRLGALTNPARREGWVRDAPAVLGITLLALPVVAPVTVLVGLALGVDWLVELVAGS